MADGGDAEILEIVERQLRQHRIVDIVVAEGGLVLPEAQRSEPAPDVHPSILKRAGMMVLRQHDVHSVERTAASLCDGFAGIAYVADCGRNGSVPREAARQKSSPRSRTRRRRSGS